MIGLRKFGLVAADTRGGGTRDESLIASSWEATQSVPRKCNRPLLLDNS